MTKIIVYHDTQTLAARSRRPRYGETVAYFSIDDWDEKRNENFDKVLNLSKKKVKNASNNSSSSARSNS